MRLSLRGFIGFAVLMAINASTAAAEVPDILGIQLGMPAREAHAKLQTELPKNKIQVISTNLPTLEEPVMASFVSEPTQTIMMGMVSDRVTVDVTLPCRRISSRCGESIARTPSLTKGSHVARSLRNCARNTGRKREPWMKPVTQPLRIAKSGCSGGSWMNRAV